MFYFCYVLDQRKRISRECIDYGLYLYFSRLINYERFQSLLIFSYCRVVILFPFVNGFINANQKDIIIKYKEI